MKTKTTPKKKQVRIKHLGKKTMEMFLVNNPEVAAKLEKLHHDFAGKQNSGKARSIRKSLRRQGIYLSKLGHFGPRHD